MSDLEIFIQQNRKNCWESEYEGGEYCIGEESIRAFFESLPTLKSKEKEAK